MIAAYKLPEGYIEVEQYLIHLPNDLHDHTLTIGAVIGVTTDPGKYQVWSISESNQIHNAIVFGTYHDAQSELQDRIDECQDRVWDNLTRFKATGRIT